MIKKASTGIYIFVIILIILIVGAIVTIYILNKKGIFNKQSDLKILKTFIIPRDSDTLIPVKANYTLEYFNEGKRVIYSSGKLEDSYNELISPINYPILFECWSNNYYLVKTQKIITPQDILNNQTFFTCDMQRIGKLNITHSGLIKEGKIFLNLTTDANYKGTSFCFSWSVGIINVAIKNQILICQDGEWKNSSFNNTYACGNVSLEGYFEKCDSIYGNRCLLKTEDTPDRFKENSDRCFNAGKNLRNETVSFELNIMTDNINSLDYLEIYIYDKDRRFIQEKNDWFWISEENKQNIGGEDYIYLIENQI